MIVVGWSGFLWTWNEWMARTTLALEKSLVEYTTCVWDIDSMHHEKQEFGSNFIATWE